MARSTGGRRQVLNQPVFRHGYRGKKKPQKSTPSNRIARFIYVTGLLMVIGAICHVSYNLFATAPYFKLSKVQIEGVSERIKGELQAIADSTLAAEKNLISLDISKLKEKIASHPRIRNLRMEKVYPDTLVIKAAEREPSAIVFADEFYLVDRDGYVISRLKNQELPAYDFPLITGIASDEIVEGEKILNPRVLTAVDLSRILREKNPRLYESVSEIHLGSDPVQHVDNLTMSFRGKLEVRFGDKNPVEKLPALELFLDMQRDQGIDPMKELAYVDLRFNNQIVYMDLATFAATASGEFEKMKQDETGKDDLPSESPRASAATEREPQNDDQAKDTDNREEKSGRAETVRQQRQAAWPEPLDVPRAAAAEQPRIRRDTAPAVQQNQPQPQQQRRGLAKFAFWRKNDQNAAQPGQPALYPAPNGAQ